MIDSSSSTQNDDEVGIDKNRGFSLSWNLETFMKIKAAGFASSIVPYLALAQNVFAQSATSSSVGGGGATSSSLPSAGTTEITYFLFAGGVALFVFGMMKLVSSFRD